jgi:transcriptional regulator with XRE-family HTH domain
MGPAPEVRIGERIRFYRQAKGRTQAVVAGLAGVSEDYLSQIERGLKTPAIGVLHRFANVLDVRISDLLGEAAAAQHDGSAPAGKAVQQALMSYAGPDSAAPADLATLRRRVDSAWGVWQGRPLRFSEESAILPELIADVQSAQRELAASNDAERRREGHRIAADLYFLLRTFAKRTGRRDLSLLVADRAVLAAQEADDPVRIAAAKWNLGHILLAQGDAESAEDVAVRAVGELERQYPDGEAEAVAMIGALWLVAAVAAVRRGDPWTARDRVRDKAWPAARRSGEGNVMRTVFGPVNVALHGMSIEMETGETAEALRLADEIDASTLPSRERQTTFALEVARCYAQRRDDPGVLLHLLSAEASGPEDMRYNNLARELVQGLLRRARPTYAPQVRAMAERIGMLA